MLFRKKKKKCFCFVLKKYFGSRTVRKKSVFLSEENLEEKTQPPPPPRPPLPPAPTENQMVGP